MKSKRWKEVVGKRERKMPEIHDVTETSFRGTICVWTGPPHSHSATLLIALTNTRPRFTTVYSSGLTGPLYLDVTLSPSLHCQ